MPNTTTFSDLINPLELVGFVRNLEFFNVDGAGTFEDFFPRNTDAQLEYKYTKGQLVDQNSAKYRAWDAEAPIVGRQGFGRVTGELAPISQKIPLTEESTLRLRALESNNYDAIIRQIYDDAANMVRSVRIRLEFARGELLSNGTVTLAENGVQGTYDAGVPSGNKVVPVGANWNDPSADILGDLTAWQVAFRTATRGLSIGEMIISQQVLTYMLKNTAIRQLAANIVGTPLAVTRAQLTEVLGAYGLPNFRVDDRLLNNSSGSPTRLIPANKVIFIPAGVPLGETLLGTPAEAIKAAAQGYITAQEAAGFWSQVWEDNDPMETWTLGTAIGLPVMPNAFFLYIATVY